ncbi:MAG: hypothetical protein BGN91_11200 [Nitrobacter sp. 62-13]|nr:MAG: hypothetical protein BGN91_11200 [Nitrobacter sp. 62-13]
MLVELYRRYRDALDVIEHDARPVGYDWGALPNPLDVLWLPYRSMFDEFSREIANSLNQLNDYTCRLKAWNVVTASMTDNEKLDATHEFIDPIATAGLTLPYVIRSRFIFAAAHLSHQANRSRDGMSWEDDFPLDQHVYFEAADKHGSGWRKYNDFKRRIEKIGGNDFKEETRDFRNAYNHRFSPRFVIGITQIAKRELDRTTKQVGYSFGGLPALSLDIVVAAMTEQYNRGRDAFNAFQALVREQEASIVAYSLRT